MTKRKYELPIANVVATVEGDTDVLLSQREEKRREMTPEEQKAADEAAIKSLYGKYKRRASDESLSLDARDKWSEAALDLEFRNPDLFND